MKLRFFLLLFLVGCNSSEHEFRRISSQANAFIVQLGTTTVDTELLGRGITPQHDRRDDCSSFVVDDEGYMYCTGQTNGSIGDLNGSGAVFVAADVYVAKFAPDGRIVWVTQMGSNDRFPYSMTGNEESCVDLALDDSKNVYCVGSTDNVMENGATARGRDALLVKFNSDGLRQWVRQIGTAGNDFFNDVVVTSDGLIICGGTTNDELTPGERTTGRTDNDVIMASFLPDGTLVQQVQLGDATAGLGNADQQDNLHDLIEDRNGNVIANIQSNGNLAGTNPSPGTADIVLWKFQSDLTNIFRRQYAFSGNNIVYSIAVSGSNQYFGALATDGQMAEPVVGNYDAGIIHFDTDGDILNVSTLGTITRLPGDDKFREDRCRHITLDRAENIYCTGNTKGSLGEPNADPSKTTDDVFIAKWDNRLRFQSVIQFGAETSFPGGDASYNDGTGGIHIDYFGNLHIGGQTGGSLGEANATIAPCEVTDISNVCRRDIFIFKMDMSTLDLSRPKF